MLVVPLSLSFSLSILVRFSSSFICFVRTFQFECRRTIPQSVEMLILVSSHWMNEFCTITCYCIYVNECLLCIYFTSIYAAFQFHHLFNFRNIHKGNASIALQLTVMHFILIKDWCVLYEFSCQRSENETLMIEICIRNVIHDFVWHEAK